MGFTTAMTIAQQRADVIQISTGCKELDNILEGEQSFLNNAAISSSAQAAWRQTHLLCRWV